MPKRINVAVECGDCGGTGLYCGFAEPAGVAVVCLRCGGSGCANLSYTPFTRRKPKAGVKYVMRSRGSFVGTGVGPVDNKRSKNGGRITYAEFEKGMKP